MGQFTLGERNDHDGRGLHGKGGGSGSTGLLASIKTLPTKLPVVRIPRQVARTDADSRARGSSSAVPIAPNQGSIRVSWDPPLQSLKA